MKNNLYIFSIMLIYVSAGAQSEHSEDAQGKLFYDNSLLSTNVVQATTNLDFYISSYKYKLFPATQFRSDELLSYGIVQTPVSVEKTNVVIFYRIPFDQTFDFHLHDKDRLEMEKTKAGVSLTKMPYPTNYGWGLKDIMDGRDVGKLQIQVVKNNNNCYALFRPDDIFIITNKGNYDLSICIRICVPMTNGIVDTNALLSVQGHKLAVSFGVVESPPLHINVTKE